MREILNHQFRIGDSIMLTPKTILITILVFFLPLG